MFSRPVVADPTDHLVVADPPEQLLPLSHLPWILVVFRLRGGRRFWGVAASRWFPIFLVGMRLVVMLPVACSMSVGLMSWEERTT